MNQENKHWIDQLGAYMDGELSPDDDSLCGEHLRSCQPCATAAMEMLLQKRMTQSAGHRYQPSVDFRRKIMQQIAAKPRFTFSSIWMPQFVAAALLIVVTIAGAVYWPALRGENAQQKQILQALADLHSTALASTSPVEVVSTDRHTVKPWFQGKLPFSFDLPETYPNGYSLLGGRIAFFNQQPAAHLVYAYKQHRISVFIFPEQDDARTWNEKTDLAGIHTETWKQNGLRYVVVGDAALGVLHALAESLQQQSLGK